MQHRKRSVFFKNSFLVLFLLLGMMGKLEAQVNAYTFSQSVATYVPLTGIPSVAYAAPWDDHTSGAAFQATLPFSFVYDGVSYTNCYISPNGFITFGTTQPTATLYSPISNGLGYSGAVSAMGTNLVSNGSPIQYGVVGTAPNRTFVVQWSNVNRKSGGVAVVGDFNFQIRLNETLNTIDLSYGTCATAVTTTITVEVGLRGPSNNAAQGNINNRSLSSGLTWFNFTNTTTTAAATVYTSSTAYPNDGLNFKYTPAAGCLTPVAPTNLVVGTTPTGNPDTVISGNSFTASVPAATNYLVLRSTVNTPPTAANVVNRTYYPVNTVLSGIYTSISTSSATTFTQTGLTPATTYYYWVIPYNDRCTGAPYYNLTNVLTASASTCYKLTTANAATAIGGNDFTANWNAVAGASGYYLDVSTNSTFTALLPGYANLSLSGSATSITVTGLLPSTTYYYRLRAYSSTPSCLQNSNTITVTTTCGYYTIPYVENFDTYSAGVLPTCYTREDLNSDGVKWETQSINYSSAPMSLYMGKNAAQDMNDWLIMPGLNLTGGVTYRLFFRYNTGNTSGTYENLKVRLGTGPSSASMNQTLLDLANINNANFQIAIVDFAPVTSGVYYIGYQGYSPLNQSYVVLDDISVTIAPSCFEPTNLVSSSLTSNSVTVDWTASSVPPANGYEYYVSTSSTPPTTSTVATGSVPAGTTTVVISGLLSSTYYYVWVRGNCGPTDKSIWSVSEEFNTECSAPVISSSNSVTRCGTGSVTLTVTATTGSEVKWYASDTSSAVLATGTSYTTPTIGSTTTYYAEAKSYGVVAKLGPVSPTSQGGLIGLQNFQSSVYFSVISNTSLLSVDIYPMTSGQSGQLILRNAANVLMAAFPFTTTVSGGATPQVIPINYLLPPGNYSLYFGVMPASGVRMNTTDVFYPYTCSVSTINGNTSDNSVYLGLYNWKFTTECLSGRTPVTAIVSTPPPLSLSATSSSICDGTATSLVTVSGYASYSSLVWSPSSGVSGSFASGFTFNPTVTTVYTLTANQTSGSLCGNVVTYTVTVIPAPPNVVVTPSAAVVCQNTVQPLNGGISSGVTVPIFTENFNAATNGWTVANNSVGGDTNASQWTLRPDGYRYVNSFDWDVTFHSNDNSQFYLANSDSQSGTPGIITRTTLTSPAISLVGYTTATLSYWQYLRYVTNDVVLVEVSTDGGVNWTTVKSYNVAQGASTSFANDTVLLDPYLGSTNFMIRFNFSSLWGYAWAVDNVSISGILATAMTWTPTTYLYTDAAATIPYTGSALGVVYSKPLSTITYTATITGTNGCSRSATSALTVVPNTNAGILSSDQIICDGGIASDLTLSGSVGSILRWEYADDVDFTANVVLVPNTTTTLTSAEMGNFATVRYFRALVKNGGCNAKYSNVVSVSFPITTWDGSAWSNGVPNANTRAIISGNYTSTGNLYACSLKVTSGTVVFNSNHSLVVTNDVFVAGGSLTFLDSSSLVQINDAVNTGNITYKRNTTAVRKFDYTYWSSPVFPQTFVDFSPLTLSDKFFQYDPTIPYWVNVASSNTMDSGKGYIIRAPNTFDPITPSVFNGSFVGVPNNGTLTTPVVVSASAMNLIGNPYPSALSADLFLSDPLNVGILDGTIYLWTHNTPITNNSYTVADYAVYNYLGGTGTAAGSTGVNTNVPNGKIAAGQSFFVKGLTTGVATFKNSMRLVGANTQFFRLNSSISNDSITEKHRLWLDLTSDQGSYKQTLIGYVTGATMGVDRGLDGAYFNSGNPVALYSLPNNATPLSIQGRSLPFDVHDEVPLGFYAVASGTFTISLSHYDGLFENQNVYLKDLTSNLYYDLKVAPYTFQSVAGTFDHRFVLVYQNPTLHSAVSNFTADSIVLYKPDGNLHIDTGTTLMKSVKVFDVRGRLLIEKQGINATSAVITLGTVPQVLFVQITSQDLTVVTKKYVN